MLHYGPYASHNIHLGDLLNIITELLKRQLILSPVMCLCGCLRNCPVCYIANIYNRCLWLFISNFQKLMFFGFKVEGEIIQHAFSTSGCWSKLEAL